MLEQTPLLRPRVSDRPFSEAGKFERLSCPFLASFVSYFCLHPVCPVWTVCILSVVKARAILCPKASFFKKRTSSKWSVFGTNILSEWIGAARSNHVSCQQNLELCKYHILQFFEVFEDYLCMQSTISVHLENLASLTISMTNMGDY